MQSAVVRVRPKTGNVLETFWVSGAEGTLQDKPVAMVPEHVVLKFVGMYNIIFVCIQGDFLSTLDLILYG